MKIKINIFFLLLSFIAYSQSKQDALNYINDYFNGENTFTKFSGGFKNNAFNNSIIYNNNVIIENPTTFEVNSIFNTTSSFNLNKVKDIILKKEYYEGHGIITFKIIFNEEIILDVISKKKNELPTKESKSVLFINIKINKEIPDSEFENFKKAVFFVFEIN